MTVSINNWYTAGGKLGEIQERCEAFQRGDQPEKIDHLTVDEIKEIHATAVTIVEFCVASLEKRATQLEFRDHETYRYARSYAKTLARVLLHRDDISRRDRRMLEKWLKREPTLPPIRIIYV